MKKEYKARLNALNKDITKKLDCLVETLKICFSHSNTYYNEILKIKNKETEETKFLIE